MSASRKSFVEALRNADVDAITTLEANNLSLIDSEQLIWATKNNRAIYTFNVKDYCQLHKNYMVDNKEHAGIIAVPRQSYSIGKQVRGLKQLITSISSENMKNQLIFLGAYITKL